MKTRALAYPLRILAVSFLISLAVLAATQTKAETTPTCMLAVPTGAVSYGLPLRLSWQTTNATALVIDNGIGAVSPVERGTVTTTPTVAGVYSATVTGPGGTARCTIGIAVQTEGIALTPAQYAEFRGAGMLPGTVSTTTPVSTTYSGSGTTADLVASLLGTVLPLPAPGTTPAPLVIVVDRTGRVLIRGIVETTGTSLITVRSWGGLWTIRSATFGPTTVVPQGAGGVSDMSALRAGDTVGIEGTVSGTIPMTVDAYFIRDWSTNPAGGNPAIDYKG